MKSVTTPTTAKQTKSEKTVKSNTKTQTTMSLTKFSTAKLRQMAEQEQDATRKSEILTLIAEREAKKQNKAVDGVAPTVESEENDAEETATDEAPEQTAVEAITTVIENQEEPTQAAVELLGESDGDDVLAAAIAAAGNAGSYVDANAPAAPATPKAPAEKKERKTKEIANGPIVTFNKFRSGEEITGSIIREIIGTEGLPYVGVRWAKENGGDDKIYYKQKGVVKYADAAEQEKATAEVAVVKAQLDAAKPPKVAKEKKEKTAATPTPSNPAQSVVIEIPEEPAVEQAAQ